MTGPPIHEIVDYSLVFPRPSVGQFGQWWNRI